MAFIVDVEDGIFFPLVKKADLSKLLKEMSHKTVLPCSDPGLIKDVPSSSDWVISMSLFSYACKIGDKTASLVAAQ